jgi:hypothetical protein
MNRLWSNWVRQIDAWRGLVVKISSYGCYFLRINQSPRLLIFNIKVTPPQMRYLYSNWLSRWRQYWVLFSLLPASSQIFFNY